MNERRPPARPISLIEALPLLCLVVGWALANGQAAFAGGGWRRYFLATVVFNGVGLAGTVATFCVGLWLEHRGPLTMERTVQRAVRVGVTGFGAAVFLALIATQFALRQ